ncbi:hypothetical protein GOODEAATRI_019572 [Goodea atripinnis]|uniref:Uncharacterized protein n=1 Tax=Goodea atripinnis TaxID=208336 RepID=A0ABV0P685_9TELE
MELPSRPAALERIAGQIIPSILLLFLGLKHLYASRQVGEDDDDNDEDEYWDEDAFEGTPLEEYSTPLDYDNGEDEYQFFTSALLRIQNSNPAWYQCLTAPLSDDQKKQLQEIYSISQQRRSTAAKGHWASVPGTSFLEYLLCFGTTT